MIKTLDFLALFLYCLLIYWLSDQSQLPAPNWVPNQDKLHHTGAYFVMAVLAWRYFKHLTRQPILLELLVICFCSLYGLSDEWHQSFVEGRVPDAADWLADSLGAVMAVVFLSLPFRNKQLILSTIK